jgi:D-beta-D-heptose 7-phosphate kinase/D-beta-D-heptose 1-phosphate adenosyltransferase
MNKELTIRAKELVDNFRQRIFVVGDVMLDRFIWGDVDRMSPEAPSCPVLSHAHETTMLGGAGNAAANLARLGAKHVRLTGLLGEDSAGRELSRLISQHPGCIHDKLLRLSSTRSTTVKTRFVNRAGGTHILRYDNESVMTASEPEKCALFAVIKMLIDPCDGILVTDYGKGVVTPDLLRLILSIGEERNIPVFIDPKHKHWEHFKGAALVKANLAEAYAALGLSVGSQSIVHVGRMLLSLTRAKAVIITLGAEGMSLFTDNGAGDGYQGYTASEESLCPSVKATDVSGAGDTAMAALVLARLAGATWPEAMKLANTAAGIAVGKAGTATIFPEDLLSTFQQE